MKKLILLISQNAQHMNSKCREKILTMNSIKILTYNEYQSENEKLNKLIFISELSGINSLKNRLDSKFLVMLKKTHELSIELVSI